MYFQGYRPTKKEEKNFEKNNSINTLLLTYLMGCSHFLPTRHSLTTQKKTKTIKKVFDADEGRNKAKTL